MYMRDYSKSQADTAIKFNEWKGGGGVRNKMGKSQTRLHTKLHYRIEKDCHERAWLGGSQDH